MPWAWILWRSHGRSFVRSMPIRPLTYPQGLIRTLWAGACQRHDAEGGEDGQAVGPRLAVVAVHLVLDGPLIQLPTFISRAAEERRRRWCDIFQDLNRLQIFSTSLSLCLSYKSNHWCKAKRRPLTFLNRRIFGSKDPNIIRILGGMVSAGFVGKY